MLGHAGRVQRCDIPEARGIRCDRTWGRMYPTTTNRVITAMGGCTLEFTCVASAAPTHPMGMGSRLLPRHAFSPSLQVIIWIEESRWFAWCIAFRGDQRFMVGMSRACKYHGPWQVFRIDSLERLGKRDERDEGNIVGGDVKECRERTAKHGWFAGGTAATEDSGNSRVKNEFQPQTCEVCGR